MTIQQSIYYLQTIQDGQEEPSQEIADIIAYLKELQAMHANGYDLK